jgi:hypothetical protein
MMRRMRFSHFMGREDCGSTDPIVVGVKPGKAGRWWHLSYGVRSWPPLPVRLLGIPPYVAVCEAERFLVQ